MFFPFLSWFWLMNSKPTQERKKHVGFFDPLLLPEIKSLFNSKTLPEFSYPQNTRGEIFSFMIYIFRKNLPDFFLSKPKFLYLYFCYTNQINKEMIYRLYILIIPLLFTQTQIIAKNYDLPTI